MGCQKVLRVLWGAGTYKKKCARGSVRGVATQGTRGTVGCRGEKVAGGLLVEGDTEGGIRGS